MDWFLFFFTLGSLRQAESFSALSHPVMSTYKGAVYEHIPVEPSFDGFENPKEVIASNLQVYARKIARAASLGVNIIVFPEYGLTGLVTSRDWLIEVAEEIPDPRIELSNPCQDDSSNAENLYQRTLSCLADQYNLYVVVNVPSREPCNLDTESRCRDDGIFLYNTNVVYNAEGFLVARYRKWNLFYESAMDKPEAPEISFFDTPFGRFGTFVCFDILFEHPAVDLVENYGIDSIVYSTAWQSKLPLMQGIGFHESWGVLFGVNLLSAEIHVPTQLFAGSGINIGARGAVRNYLDLEADSTGRLLISNLPVNPPQPVMTFIPPLSQAVETYEIFTSRMRGNYFTFVPLTWESHEIIIGQHDTSCLLRYRFESFPVDELYAFGVFQGLHRSSINSYLEVCALVKCANSSDSDTCGDSVADADGLFEYFEMAGQFSTKYIYPSVIVDGGLPVDKGTDWHFKFDTVNQRAHIAKSRMDHGLVYATLYGRVYDLDDM